MTACQAWGRVAHRWSAARTSSRAKGAKSRTPGVRRGPCWSDPTWIAAELTLHAAAMTAPGSDLQALALRAAGVVARVEVS